MKTNLIFFSLSLLSISVFSQEMNYEVRATYARAIKQEALQSPKLMRDLIEGYPVNWISTYTSSEISATCQGKERKAMSRNDTLSPEQQEILKTADLASKIVITIKYSYLVPVTRVTEHNDIFVSMTVVPENEAQYAGGHEQLIRYLKEHSPSTIPTVNTKERQQLLIRFTINEQGKVIDPKMIRSFGDVETDHSFLELIKNMPAWKPAENPKGIRVKQEFEFVAGKGVEGC
jgi:TonB family protein